MNATTTHISSVATRSRQLLSGVRDDLRELRSNRRAHRQLARDLAAYSTPAEIDDLLAVIDGDDSAEAQQIRHILAVNLQRRHAFTLVA